MTIPHIQGFIMKLNDIIKHLESLKTSDPRFEQDLLEIEIDIDCNSDNIYVASQIQGEPTIEVQFEMRAEAVEDLSYALFYAFADFGISNEYIGCDDIARALFTDFSFERFIQASKEMNISYKDGLDKHIFERLIPTAKKIGIFKQ